jgi:hypothetical protein
MFAHRNSHFPLHFSALSVKTPIASHTIAPIGAKLRGALPFPRHAPLLFCTSHFGPRFFSIICALFLLFQGEWG